MHDSYIFIHCCQERKLGLSRAHTLCLDTCSLCTGIDEPVMLTISTNCAYEQKVVGTIDGHGYDGQQKDAIYDVHGSCLTILSTFKLYSFFLLIVTGWLRLGVARTPRCQDLAILW